MYVIYYLSIGLLSSLLLFSSVN